MRRRIVPLWMLASLLVACGDETSSSSQPPGTGGAGTGGTGAGGIGGSTTAPGGGGAGLVCTGTVTPLPEPEGSPPTLNVCTDSWPLARGTLDYSAGGDPDPTLIDAIARRFEFTVGGERNAQAYFENAESVYRGDYVYNSLTDNNVSPDHDTSEHDWLMAHASSYGISGEDAYLHFWTDTIVRLEGQEIAIAGWQPDSPKAGASASSREESRIPVYYADLSRRATNFASAPVRQLHRDYNIEAILDQPLFGDTYPLGIMFDNTGHAGQWTGLQVTIVNGAQGGGQVAEHPTHLAIGGEGFEDWRWFEGVGLFISEFRDYVAECPEEVGNRPITLMPNVAAYVGNVLGNSLELFGGGGISLLAEFEYNPTRMQDEHRPLQVFQAEKAAIDVDIAVFHPGFPATTVGEALGSYTRDQSAMNGLALEWVIRTENEQTGAHSTMQGVQVNATTSEGWDTNLLPVFDADLGRPLGDPFLLAEGTDGSGYPYAIYARDFACGFSIVRARGSYDENIDEATAVDVALPASLVPVDCSGALLPATTSWSLRNGQGQIFLKAG